MDEGVRQLRQYAWWFTFPPLAFLASFWPWDWQMAVHETADRGDAYVAGILPLICIAVCVNSGVVCWVVSSLLEARGPGREAAGERRTHTNRG